VFSQVDGQDGSGSCDDGWKGDGECDEVNDKAECDYDDGDCCKKEWIGDGDCDARNNFIQCHYDYGDCCEKEYAGDGFCDAENNFIGCHAVTDKYGTNFKQTKTGKTGYQNDGGDCFPRECFGDEDDPLDAAYTTKYGKFWYNQVTDDRFEEPDPQGFFSAITNQNECRALSCLLSGESDQDNGWEFEDFFCDTTHLNGSSYQYYYDDFGSGCYCGAGGTSLVPAECCFYDDCTWDDDIMIDCDDDGPEAAYTSTLGTLLKKAGKKKKKKRYQG